MSVIWKYLSLVDLFDHSLEDQLKRHILSHLTWNLPGPKATTHDHLLKIYRQML